jgi:hypothetical protein
MFSLAHSVLVANACGMTSKSDDLEKELRHNFKLRRELQSEIARAETGVQVAPSRWLRLRDWLVTRWLDFWGEDRRRR